MNTLSYSLLGLLALGAGQVAIADESSNEGLFSYGESFSQSGASPLTSYLNALIGPAPEGGKYVLSRNLFEFGYRYKRLEVSFVHRNDYNLYFSRGASQFVYLNQNQSNNFPLDQRFDVDITANQYQLSGLKFGYSYSVSPSLDLYASYAQYQATESVYGYMGKHPDGSGGFIGKTRVDQNGTGVVALEGQLYTRYYYTDDVLFSRDVNAPTGTGYSIDLGFHWQLMPNLTLSAKFYDVLGEISWSDMPYTEAEGYGFGDNQMLYIDEDGSIQVRANFEGDYDERDFTQKLARRDKINLDYQYKNYVLGYQFDKMKPATFHRISGGYVWKGKWGAVASYDLTSDAMGLDFLIPLGKLYVATDRLDITGSDPLYRTRSFTFGWSVNYPF